MNDRKILGLGEQFSYEELKKAFREKSKQFHPDKNSDNMNSHLSMIRVNQAYANLLQAINDKPVQNQNRDDKAYTFYKEGIDKFQSIHPSKWKRIIKNDIFNAHAIETNPDTIEILKDLINLMSEAYYSFSIVVNEYSDSCWVEDAKLKLKEIEKMTVRYSKIKKSYIFELKL